MNDGENTRIRSSAVAISNETKKRLSKDIGNLGFIEDEKRKENFILYLENKFGGKRKSKIIESDFIDFPVPEHKSLITNPNTKIFISENASVVQFKTKLEDIKNEENVKVKFSDIIEEYDENSINQFEIQDLINFDFEEIALNKEKINDLLDKSSILANSSKNKETEETYKKLTQYVGNILNELKSNEKQAKILINNIENLDTISYKIENEESEIKSRIVTINYNKQ